MSTRRDFILALPAATAAFAVAGGLLAEPAHAQQIDPLSGQFDLKGKPPSKYTLNVLKKAM